MEGTVTIIIYDKTGVDLQATLSGTTCSLLLKLCTCTCTYVPM